MDTAAQSQEFSAWQTSQANARHFNELLTKIRSLAIFLMAAAISSIFALENREVVVIGVVSFLMAIMWFTFYLLDRWYYHILLEATIQWAGEIEDEVFKDHVHGGLSKHVKKRNEQAGLLKAKTGGQKVAIFYAIPLFLSIGAGAFSILSPSSSLVVSLALSAFLAASATSHLLVIEILYSRTLAKAKAETEKAKAAPVDSGTLT